MNYDDSIRVKLEDGSFLKIWSNDVIARTVGNELLIIIEVMPWQMLWALH